MVGSFSGLRGKLGLSNQPATDFALLERKIGTYDRFRVNAGGEYVLYIQYGGVNLSVLDQSNAIDHGAVTDFN